MQARFGRKHWSQFGRLRLMAMGLALLFAIVLSLGSQVNVAQAATITIDGPSVLRKPGGLLGQ